MVAANLRSDHHFSLTDTKPVLITNLVATTLNDILVWFSHHRVVFVGVFKFAQDIAHRVNASTLLVIRFNSYPRRFIGIGVSELLFLGAGVRSEEHTSELQSRL